MTKNIKHKSRLLSLILRHRPELAGLILGPGGWVKTDALLKGLKSIDRPMDQATLEHIVNTNDKKRFTMSEDGTRIRAAQGHTVNIDLGLSPIKPPEMLYHGTATRFLQAIWREGLKPMKRDHVHLSADVDTASKVGMRHGKIAILKVDAGGLHAAGQVFYQADNGVWLTGPIAPKWLSG